MKLVRLHSGVPLDVRKHLLDENKECYSTLMRVIYFKI